MRLLLLVCVLGAAIWAGNTSVFVTPSGELKLLAHRGVHQTYAGGTPDNDTCTANPIDPVTHPHLENTIPSMQAAFDLGAEVVELDVHLTPDGTFAVFHDWTLDCRTDGTGQTNKTPFSTLQTLDAAYGYTSDGETYPLRGTGVGAIPSLTDVLASFPDRRFLINFKSNRRSEGVALAAMMDQTPGMLGQVYAVYGGRDPSEEVSLRHPDIRHFDWGSVRTCLTRYVGIGWTGWMPRVCRNTIVIVPTNYARWLWGWPGRFAQRLKDHGTDIIIVGPYHGSRAINGIDTAADFDALPQIEAYVWSNDLPAVNP